MTMLAPIDLVWLVGLFGWLAWAQTQPIRRPPGRRAATEGDAQ